jgi:hypothetical protein
MLEMRPAEHNRRQASVPVVTLDNSAYCTASAAACRGGCQRAESPHAGADWQIDMQDVSVYGSF